MRTLRKMLIIGALAAISADGVIGQASAGTKTTVSKPFGVYVNVTSTATVALSGSTFTWNAIKPTVNSYVAASSGPMQVTGGIRTSPSGGAGSIVIMAPGDLQGPKTNNTLPIKEFALTCSGSNTGTQPTYAPALTTLKANSSVPCATWGPGATTKLGFNLTMYLQTQNVQQGVYQSQAFSIIATST